MKVRNIASNVYIGPSLTVHPGEEIEVADAQGAYLLSADCPGRFEQVKPIEPPIEPKKRAVKEKA